jgi:hypothetical protein
MINFFEVISELVSILNASDTVNRWVEEDTIGKVGVAPLSEWCFSLEIMFARTVVDGRVFGVEKLICCFKHFVALLI